MAQNLTLFPEALPYIGAPFGQEIGACTPLKQPPRVVRIDLNWVIYGAGPLNKRVAVKLNLLAQGTVNPQGALDKIRSVYIDNTFSLVPVYVQFPDSLYTVVCPPMSVTCQPVFTNVQECSIFAEGFATGQVPLTRIHFSNVERQGYYVPSDFTFANPIRPVFWQSYIAAPQNTTSFSFGFNPVSVGPANAARIVGIPFWITAKDTITLTNVNINGGSETPVEVKQGFIPFTLFLLPTKLNFMTGIIWALEPLGTSVSVGISGTVAGGAGQVQCGIGAYTIENLLSTTPYSSGGVEQNAQVTVVSGGYDWDILGGSYTMQVEPNGFTFGVGMLTAPNNIIAGAAIDDLHNWGTLTPGIAPASSKPYTIQFAFSSLVSQLSQLQNFSFDGTMCASGMTFR